MSIGDQITAEVIDAVGVFLSELISAFFTAFVAPLFQAIAAVLGIGGG